jgi:MtN3 and saliva related transmembrane protein
MTQTIGIIAGILTTGAFLPQVWRTWRTKSVEDLSLTMLVTFLLGIGGWLVYGIRLGEPPIVVSNLVTIVLTLILIGFKIKFGTQVRGTQYAGTRNAASPDQPSSARGPGPR